MANKRKLTKKEIANNERMAKQRAKRGFSDEDVWSIDYWFCETISPMLKQLAKIKHGFHTLDENGDFIYKEKLTTEESELFDKRWKDTILHMAYLADEMSETKCSMKNPYDKEFHRIHRVFEKKYGFWGEKLWSEEDKKTAEGKGGHPWYGPEDDPNHGEEYRKIIDAWYDCEKQIEEYRDKCKDEFFVLFSKYFRCLWD